LLIFTAVYFCVLRAVTYLLLPRDSALINISAAHGGFVSHGVTGTQLSPSSHVSPASCHYTMLHNKLHRLYHSPYHLA